MNPNIRFAKYVCGNCGSKQFAKHVDARRKAGFGLQHIECYNCGEKQIRERGDDDRNK
jgi:hypothetical protein